MTDLIDRQATIDALKEEKYPCETDYDEGFMEALDKVIWIVGNWVPSAQPKTFHVIDNRTGQEADPYEIALHEEWAKGLMYCDMEGFAIEEDGTLILVDECGRHEYCPEGRFEVVWDE